MGAKEVVEEFKFYLRCTPTEKADEMVQDKVENGVIMERQG